MKKTLFTLSTTALLFAGCEESTMDIPKNDLPLIEKSNIDEKAQAIPFSYSSNSRVVILGYAKEDNDPTTNDQHEYGYWIDGTWHTLPNTWSVKSIAFNGGDVYVGGTKKTGVVTGGIENWRATYWKNNTEFLLPEPAGILNSQVSDLLFANNNLYISTIEHYGSNTDKAVIWENGQRKYTQDNAYFTEIGMLNGDIYAVGYFFDYNKGYAIGKVWKNNQEIQAYDMHKLYAMSFSKEALIAIGQKVNIGQSYYWVNGQKKQFDNTGYYGSFINGLTTSDQSQIIAAGSVFVNTPRFYSMAVVWRDDKLDIIDDSQDSYASDVARIDGKELIAGGNNTKGEAYLWVDGIKYKLNPPAGKPFVRTYEIVIKN